MNRREKSTPSTTPACALIPIRRMYDSPRIDDPARAVMEGLRGRAPAIAPGSSIAVAVGSRGITGIADMTQAVVAYVKERGGRPFIVPAMGSHGGATAEGQRGILAGYGITAEHTGAPVRSSMEVAELPSSDLPVGLFMDRLAWESDGVILVNRIKPHTDYHGPFESGLVKMAVIGLGKHRQALEIHRYGLSGLKELMPRCARAILASGKILCGVAIVENACDDPCLIEAMKPPEILDREPELLQEAKQRMPSLPVEDIDVLIIDRIGKDISGVGIDPNIIGRLYIRGEPEPDTPRIQNIVATDLSDGSHGNALGIGLADVISSRLHGKIDFPSMYENARTSTFLERVKMPFTADTDAHAYEIALRACGPIGPGKERVVRIRDTLHLTTLYVSPALAEELRGRNDIEVLGRARAMFDEKGGLVDDWND